MVKENKAHTATIRRIAARYGGKVTRGDGPDIRTDSLLIEVETSATLKQAISRLENRDEPAYVAVTNKEAIAEALRLASDTSVGIMDPQGNILRESAAN